MCLQTVIHRLAVEYGPTVIYKKLIRRCDNERELFTTTSSTTFTQCAPESTEFVEITQDKSHYAVQGLSRLPILVPIESSYTISY